MLQEQKKKTRVQYFLRSKPRIRMMVCEEGKPNWFMVQNTENECEFKRSHILDSVHVKELFYVKDVQVVIFSG
jgi:hypothetical protein